MECSKNVGEVAELHDLSGNEESVPFSSLVLETCEVSPTVCRCVVTVPAEVVNALYDQAAKSQQSVVQAPGFVRGTVPVDYIKQNFREHLVEHLKEFLLKFCVTNFLYQEIRARKFLIVGEPRLTSVTIAPNKVAQFTFDANTLQDVIIYDWKYLPFNAPRRKRYRDLDRQVKNFVAEEVEAREAYADERVRPHDWIQFRATILDEDRHRIVAPDVCSDFWLKVGEDETESSLKELFLGCSIGDTIVSDNKALQEYFSNDLDSGYTFQMQLKGIVPHAYFSVDDFKKQFRVKTRKDTHEKFIEVFSFRDHITQRRAMAQEALALLITKNPFDVPNHLVLRQQEEVLRAVRNNPDYNVYRTQPDFDYWVRQLALQQVKETAFSDSFAYYENLAMTDHDVRCYLNLTNRPRMKEFLYFAPPPSKMQGQEMPIPAEQLKRSCLREKALNHAIYHLTKD